MTKPIAQLTLVKLIAKCGLVFAVSLLGTSCLAVIAEDAIAQSQPAISSPESAADAVTRVDALLQQVELLFSQEQYDEALSVLQSALSIGTETFGENSIETVETLKITGLAYWKKQDPASGIPFFEQAISIQESVLGKDHPDLGYTLNYLATLYRDIGDDEKELSLRERALLIQESQLGSRHLDVARTLTAMAMLYIDRLDYAKALPFAEQSLAIQEAALEPNHPDVVDSLKTLGLLYYMQGNYSSAQPLLEKVIRIQETISGPDSLAVTESLLELGDIYKKQANYDAAQALFERSLSIREKALGSQDLQVAENLAYLGTLHLEKEEYLEALPLYERSLQIREAIAGKNHISLSTVLSNLGLLQSGMGNKDAARALYERAVAIEQSYPEADRPTVSAAQWNLASLYYEEGNYAKALSFYQQCLAEIESSRGKNHPRAADALGNMAILHSNTGNYTEALLLAERSLAIREASFGQTHPAVANSLTTLAQIYQDQGNHIAAKPLLDRALRIQEDIFGKNNTETLSTLSTLATWYRTQGDYVNAQSLFEEVLSIRETSFSGDRRGIASSLNNLAYLYQTQGKYAAARSLHERALSINTAMFGEAHPNNANSLNNLALIYSAQGDYSQALALYKRSLSILQAALGKNYPNVAVNLQNMAGLYEKQGEFLTALDLYVQAGEIEEHNLTEVLASASETRRQRYAVALSNSINSNITLNLKELPNNTTATRLALTTLFRRKGRVLDAVSNSSQQLRQRLSPEDSKLLDVLNVVRAQLTALRFDGPQDRPIAGYQTVLAQLEAEAERLDEQLSRQSAAYQVETASVSVESVQALIPKDAALVEFVRYTPLHFDDAQAGWNTDRYAAYILSAQGDIQAVDLGEAAPIEQLVAEFRRSLSTRATNIKTVARQLDEQLIAPIRPFLSDKTHLLLSPDSQLNLIPFDALVDSQSRYLIETYQVSYLNSGRDLLRMQLDAPSRQSALVIANPDYEGDRGAQGNGQRSVDASSLTFGPLPGTAAEGRAIASLLPSATLLTQQQATESALKQVAGPNILHIATHGFFLPDVDFAVPDTDSRGASLDVVSIDDSQQPAEITPSNLENPLLRSGLALAGVNNRRSGGEDGIFTALEASGLDLYGTQLVVLSACETGIGVAVSGEGVYGLRRAFAIAGAESQLMSLWQVDDTGTSELMQLYYKNLIEKNQGRSEALRAAQLEMVNTGTYAHPYYWSSFIFSGDWRPL